MMWVQSHTWVLCHNESWAYFFIFVKSSETYLYVLFSELVKNIYWTLHQYVLLCKLLLLMSVWRMHFIKLTKYLKAWKKYSACDSFYNKPYFDLLKDASRCQKEWKIIYEMVHYENVGDIKWKTNLVETVYYKLPANLPDLTSYHRCGL